MIAEALAEPMAASDVSTLTDDEREISGQLYIALGRLARWSARQAAEQFGPGVISALGTIVDHGPLRLGELAAREGISPASLSRIIAILEARSLLTRTVDPEDRRSSFVLATATGRAIVHDRRRDRGERLAVHLAPLTTDRLDAMREIVRAIDGLAAAT